MFTRSTLVLAVLLALAALVGCVGRTPAAAEPTGDYATVSADPRRDTEAARQHDARGLQLLCSGELDRAELAFKAALDADVMFGPAHNNLGAVYLRQSRLYLAAWEFQYAVKLMPSHPEPRNNLGLVFEAAGRLDDAIDWFDQAVDLGPDDPELIGNLARARIRRGDSDAETRDLLTQLVMKDTRPEWVTWARQRLVLMHDVAED